MNGGPPPEYVAEFLHGALNPFGSPVALRVLLSLALLKGVGPGVDLRIPVAELLTTGDGDFAELHLLLDESTNEVVLRAVPLRRSAPAANDAGPPL